MLSPNFAHAAGAAVPMPRPVEARGLVGLAAWSLLGNAVYIVAQWGMLIILARCFPRDVLGSFAYALAIANPLFTFTNLQLRTLVAADPLPRHGDSQYLGVRGAGLLLACALSVIAWLAAGGVVTAALMGLVIAAKAGESACDLCLGFMQRAERNDMIAMSLILRGAGMTGLCLYLALVAATPLAAAAAMAVANAGVLIVHDLPRSLNLPRYAAGTDSLGRLLRAGLPMGLTLLASSLALSVPRFLLKPQHGLEAVAVFSALAYLPMAGSIAVASIGAPFGARLAALHVAGDAVAFRSLARRLGMLTLGLGALGLLLAVVCGEPLVRLIYGAGYAGHQTVLIVLCLAGAAAMLSSAQGIIMTAARIHGAQLITGVTALAVLILACWWLVPNHGLLGAAVACLLSATAMTALRWPYTRAAVGRA